MALLTEISTTDPEQALPVLEEYFPGVRMSNPQGDFAMQLVGGDSNGVSLVRYHLRSLASSSSVAMGDDLTFGKLDQGTMGLVTAGEQIDTTRPWLFPEDRVHADWNDITITALTVSKAVTQRMARTHLGDDTAHLRFTATAPIDDYRAQQWAAFMDYMRLALTEKTPGLSSPLVRSAAVAHLVGIILETFPNTVADAFRQQSRPTVTAGATRRAVQFIDANAHLPITVEDIARESRLSVRALQYAFRREHDTTPVLYLRRVRLAGAHQALRAADPTTGATVRGILLEWGFSHAGRFAEQYRATYGVSPRRTLGL